MNPRFTLLAAATSALLTAVVPSLAQLYQTVVPSEPPGGAQGALSIPDFSGIWAHYSFPGFEPPISGPRSVMNKLHVANPREARTVGDRAAMNSRLSIIAEVSARWLSIEPARGRQAEPVLAS
jgi:hypothetical protein